MRTDYFNIRRELLSNLRARLAREDSRPTRPTSPTSPTSPTPAPHGTHGTQTSDLCVCGSKCLPGKPLCNPCWYTLSSQDRHHWSWGCDRPFYAQVLRDAARENLAAGRTIKFGLAIILFVQLVPLLVRIAAFGFRACCLCALCVSVVKSGSLTP